MNSLYRQISRVSKQLLGGNGSHTSHQCSQFVTTLSGTATAKKDETATDQSKLSLKNRFLHATLCPIILEDTITPEEENELYGYLQRGGRGRNMRPKPQNRDKYLQKWESWARCNDMSEEAAQEKFIEMMNSIRTRAGLPKI